MAGFGTLQDPTTVPESTGVGAFEPRATRIAPSSGAAYALGDVYNEYKKAQLEQVTQSTARSAAARQRLTQIWEAGAANPALQKDPRLVPVIGQLYKAMGVPAPIDAATGSVHWDALAPVKNIMDLQPQVLEWLTYQPPDMRKKFVQANHIIGVDDGWLNMPAMPTPQQKVAFQNEYQHMILGGGFKGMTASAFRSWVENNRNLFEHTLGPGTTDATLNDPKIFSDMQTQAETSLGKMQNTIAEIKARTKSLLGITPDKVAQIAKDAAEVRKAAAVTDLDKIRTRYVGAQLKDLPALDQAKIGQLNASADALNAQAGHWDAVVKDLKVNGGDYKKQFGLLKEALGNAQTDYRTASSAYTSAANAGFGIPDEVQQAYDSAKARLDTVQKAYDDFASPGTQGAIRANSVKRTNGANATPVNTGAVPNFAATAKDRDGKEIMLYNGRWVHQDGSKAAGT